MSGPVGPIAGCPESSIDVEYRPGSFLIGALDCETWQVRQFSSRPGVVGEPLSEFRAWFEAEKHSRLWLNNGTGYDNALQRLIMRGYDDTELLYTTSVERVTGDHDARGRVNSIVGEPNIDLYLWVQDRLAEGTGLQVGVRSDPGVAVSIRR